MTENTSGLTGTITQSEVDTKFWLMLPSPGLRSMRT